LIEPLGKWSLPNLAEFWGRRELLYFLVWRDIRVRYSQAVLGIAWAVLNPLLLAGAFTVFFGVLFSVPTEGVPRAAFIFAGMLTWRFFGQALSRASNCLRKEKNLLAKLYFPRLIVPVSSVLTELVDFAIGLIALLIMVAALGLPARATFLLLPGFALLAGFIALSVGIWFAPLAMKYDDFQHILPLLTQVWFWASAIFYPVSVIPDQWRAIYRLNPMVGIIEGVRWSLFESSPPPDVVTLAISLTFFGVLLVAGVVRFNRVQWAFDESF
jgi:lipopolysaccharide transport system permease protein